MNIQEMLLTTLTSFTGIIILVIVRMLKEYLLQKGGAAAVRTLEIVANHAVQAVEQLAKDPEVELHGEQKLELAKEKVSTFENNFVKLKDIKNILNSNISSVNKQIFVSKLILNSEGKSFIDNILPEEKNKLSNVVYNIIILRNSGVIHAVWYCLIRRDGIDG